MNIGELLLIVGGLCALGGIYFMVGILRYLKSRGEKISMLMLRLYWFRYMSRYRELTKEQTGHTGSFFGGYIISMILSLVFIVTGALILGN